MPLSNLDPPRIRTNYHIGQDLFYPDEKNLRSLKDSTSTVPLSRPYNTIRGMFLPKRNNTFDISRQFLFQFNPEEIKITKDVVYTSRSYTGLDYTDYIWANGGEKSLQFTLFIDATAGSMNSQFRNAFTTGIENISDVETKKPRGVLDDCELLESFTRPDVPVDGPIKTPKFSSGGIVPPAQFYPPPTLVFVYGNFYFEGILRNIDWNYSTFRKDLVTTRAEINITFNVFEQEEVSINSLVGAQKQNAVANSGTGTNPLYAANAHTNPLYAANYSQGGNNPLHRSV